MEQANANSPAAGSVQPRVPMLLGLTAVTGIVDAVSFLALGHVFTANMTGNIVFLAFAVAGTPGLSMPRSTDALMAFLIGAVLGGKIAGKMERSSQSRWSSALFLIESVFLLTATLTSIGCRSEGSEHVVQIYAIIALTAFAMGIRNAAARKLAVPDMTTTVLTLTIYRAGSRFLASGGWKSTLAKADLFSSRDVYGGGGWGLNSKALPCSRAGCCFRCLGHFCLWSAAFDLPESKSPCICARKEKLMQIGMIGLGRMGANMVRRLLNRKHHCVVFNRSPKPINDLVREGATGSDSLADFARKLARPRAVWLMVPAAAVDQNIAGLLPHLESGDILIDGGNSYYKDDIRRAKDLAAKNVHYVDVGTSGGVWGLERGYCMMIGANKEAVDQLDPIFAALAPGIAAATRTPGRESLGGTAEQGYLHCGPHGAGHFVKMVHNGIEYGLMAAYAEGLGILHRANIGKGTSSVDVETTPLRDPEEYQYDFDLRDVAEVWRRGSVIASWLLDLTATALVRDPSLAQFEGRVSDSSEGRWTIKAAVDEAVPVPVLSSALYERFASRGEADFQDKLLSAMRFGFGGHSEKPAG